MNKSSNKKPIELLQEEIDYKHVMKAALNNSDSTVTDKNALNELVI